MYKTVHIIRTCIKYHVPCMLENPSSSMLWQAHPIMQVLNHDAQKSITCDQCQFGARWRKRTRIASWFCHGVDSLDLRCTGHGGMCSRNGRPHIVLKGQSPSGALWISISQEYPSQLSNVLATILTQSYISTLHEFFSNVCGKCQFNR